MIFYIAKSEVTMPTCINSNFSDEFARLLFILEKFSLVIQDSSSDVEASPQPIKFCFFLFYLDFLVYFLSSLKFWLLIICTLLVFGFWFIYFTFFY